MNVPPDMTFGQLEALLPNGAIVRHLKRLRISSSNDYDQFLEILYGDIDSCLFDMQRAPDERCNDGEDRLTDELAIQLRRLDYDAVRGAQSGGSVDLTVKLGGHYWNGEAKKDYKFLDGFNQLTLRYRPASGDPRHCAGGMLLYLTKNVDLKVKLDAWKTELQGSDPPEFEFDSKVDSNPNAFRTKHRPDWTTVPLTIRHVMVPLYHRPNDAGSRSKAGRDAKRAAKAGTPAKAAKSKKSASAPAPSSPAQGVN